MPLSAVKFVIPPRQKYWRCMICQRCSTRLEPRGARIGGHRTLIRALKTRSIALGGDSAVRVVDGELVIGPERKGPAMAYGGPSPTPTDALFVLGRAQTVTRKLLGRVFTRFPINSESPSKKRRTGFLICRAKR